MKTVSLHKKKKKKEKKFLRININISNNQGSVVAINEAKG